MITHPPRLLHQNIREPFLTHQLMLSAPQSDGLCVISVCGTGKSLGITLLVARDAAHFKAKYGGLITSTTSQSLIDLAWPAVALSEADGTRHNTYGSGV